MQWPLLPGTQDRLSWMIQLAGIAAADPALVAEPARGSPWSSSARAATPRSGRCARSARDSVETAAGTVAAIKLVRDDRSGYDSGYEIWLDPAHAYLPVHATQRNARGEPEFDLLLESVEVGP